MLHQHSITDDAIAGPQSQQRLLRSPLATIPHDGFAKEVWVFPLDAGTNVVAHQASDIVLCTGGMYALPHDCAKSLEELERYEKENDAPIPEASMIVFSVGSSVLELDEGVATFLYVHRKIAAIATACRSLVREGNRPALPCPIVFGTRSEFGYLPLRQYSPQDAPKFLSAKVAIILPLHYGIISQRRLPTSVVTLNKNIRFLKDCTQQVSRSSGYLKGSAYTGFPGRLCCPASNSTNNNNNNNNNSGIMICSCDWGSHVDSPSHFYDANEGARTISDLTGQELFAPAVFIDISSRVPLLKTGKQEESHNYYEEDDPKIFDVEVTVEDLVNWERQNYKTIPSGAIICMKSGWSSRFNQGNDKYNNFDPRDNTTMHFPGFSVEAAEWLVQNRKIAGVAVDTLSTDVGSSSTYQVHRIILGKSMFNVENLDFSELSNNSEKVGKNIHLIVAPLKVKGAPEAPCRCVAVEILDE